MDFFKELPFSDALENDLYNYNQLLESDHFPFEQGNVKDFPKTTINPKIGLTTKSANERIIALLTDRLNEYDDKLNLKVLFKELIKLDVVFCFMVLLLHTGNFGINLDCVGSFIYSGVSKKVNYCYCTFELVMLLFWFGLNVYLKLLYKICKANKKRNRVSEIIYYLKYEFVYPYHAQFFGSSVNLSSSVALSRRYNIDPSSSDFISVYRDFQWVRLPRNILVKGDVYKLRINDIFPCHSKLILSFEDNEPILDDKVLEQGSKFGYEDVFGPEVGGGPGDFDKFIDGTFIALSDSITKYIDFYLNPTKPESPEPKADDTVTDIIFNYNDNYIFVKNNLDKNNLFVLFIIMITFMLELVWILSYRFDHLISLLRVFCDLFLVYKFVATDAIYKIAELWGNVKLVSIFDIYHDFKLKNLHPVRSLSSSTSFLSSSSSYVSEDADSIVKEITVGYQLKEVKRVLRNGLIGESSLIHQLSSITLLSFIDDIGILLDGNQSLQEISIITNQRSDLQRSANTVRSIGSGENMNLISINSSIKSEEYDLDENHQISIPNTQQNSLLRETTSSLGSSETFGTISHTPSLSNSEENDDLLILDIYNDINLYGKDNIRFINDYEKNNKNLLKPLVFSMSLTNIPTPTTTTNVRTNAQAQTQDVNTLCEGSNVFGSYLSMLLNSELVSYNNCLCILSSTLNIKKIYLRRFKLLKFIIIIDNSIAYVGSKGDPDVSDELVEYIVDEKTNRNIVLLYFYRDINKKVVQMLVKCKINVLNEFKFNYYNGLGIKPLSKGLKKKLKDLDIQWLSNGINSFLYLYKPISINDFNILLFLLPYITVYYKLNTFQLSTSESYTGHEKESPRRVSNTNKDGLKSKKSGIIKSRFKDNIFMYMYKSNNVYYKCKGVNIFKLSQLYKTTNKAHHNPKIISRISKTCVENEEVAKVKKDIILASYIGEMLNSYIKNSVFLGMVGIKYDVNKDINNIINDLHECGIRFVYFSKHNEKYTRIIGSLLGLEISWNSMISLSHSETSSYVNQEGHMVLPSGIDNIKQHIKHIDDIPLQVSLFCNCNYNNVIDMFGILNENKENIMCIGSGLNSNNFYLFHNSFISFSISLNYNPLCKFCKCKRWQGNIKQHVFEESKSEVILSSLVTSLSCSLYYNKLYKVSAFMLNGFQISNINLIFDVLFELFKESRSITTNIQEILTFMILSYLTIIFIHFLQSLLSLTFIFDKLDFITIVYIYIPLLSLTLLKNPIMDKIMEQLPNKIQVSKKNANLNNNKYQLRIYLRLLVFSLFLVMVYYINLFNINHYVNTKLYINHHVCSSFLHYPKIYCVNYLNDYIRENGIKFDYQGCIKLIQFFTSITYIVFLMTSSIFSIQKYSFIGFICFQNIYWVLACILIIGAQICIVTLRVHFMDYADFKVVNILLKNTGLSVLLVFPMILIDQVIKYFIIKDKNTQQKFLQLLFSTKLGTWSPK